jgi:hypothetical protein
MRRLVVLLTIAALAALPACKKESPPQAEKKTAEAPPEVAKVPEEAPAPAPDVNAAPAPAPAPAPDVNAAQAGEVKDPWAEYVVVGTLDPNMGPAAPPVAGAEVELATDLAKGWTKVPVARNPNDPAPDIGLPKEAALAPETLNNRALYVFEILALERDADYFVDKLLPEAADYMELRNNLGITITANDRDPLEKHLRAEFTERLWKYKTYIGPVKREDRFGVMVSNRMTRLTRFTFEYEDINGAVQEDCLLFILLDKGWCVLDFGCDDEPWLRPSDFVAPTNGDVTTEGNAQTGEVISQIDAGRSL